MPPSPAEPSPGQFQLRGAVSLEGPVLFSRSPLSVTRLNEAARTVVDALDTEQFLDPATVADRAEMDQQAVASLLSQLQNRGFLDWKPSRESDYTPLVSVVVTTLNSATDLGACLDALEGLDYPDYEVVLVDGGSADRTVELARSHELAADGRLRVVEPAPEDAPLSIGAGRNRGVAAASGEMVAFTDADCRPRAEWLADLVPCLAVHDVVGGRIRPAGDTPVDSYEGDHSSLDMGPRSARVDPDSNTPYLPTANLLARREVCKSVSFPDRNIAEDVAFCWGALADGFDVVYHASGIVEHAYEGQPRAFGARRAAYGASEALLARGFGHGDGVPVPLPSIVGVFALALSLAAALLGWDSRVRLGSSVAGLAGLCGPPLWRTGTALRQVRTVVSPRTVLVSSLRGVLSTWYAVTRELARYYTLPAAALGGVCLLAGAVTAASAVTAVGATTLSLVAAVVAFPLVVEVLVYRPAKPGRYVFWAVLDTWSYQAGAYKGIFAYRTVRHLVPWRRFRLA